ncbi:MAG: hypothetical protein A2900_05190 [Candidatus Chisholmbacteria bacterium RIFCSPLOWO2_01_FULL_50_28]|nr:MAG: hypothetical protein A2900_05190 [Candidatus Chisholmbacteria bacterium RIFCSPLOWO2_01_FULL_50_28]
MKPCRRFFGFDGGSPSLPAGGSGHFIPLQNSFSANWRISQFWFPTRLILESLLQRLQKGEEISVGSSFIIHDS